MNKKRSPHRGRRRATGRFYAILIIAAILIVAGAIFGIVKFIGAYLDAAEAGSGAIVTPAPDNGQGAESSAGTTLSLAELLGAENGEIAGLSADQMVTIEDLSVNTSLSPEWKNVLLLGTDERTLTESARTDAMIICSINMTTGQVKLTSILRDLAVDFNDIGQYSGTYRINAANYFGGPKLAMKTVNECFNLNIEDYVVVNFFGFQQVAEKLGGIVIDITEEEMEQINLLIVEQAKIAYREGIDESELQNQYLETFGPNTHLDGRQTLAYSRIRKIDSDISRAERQRTVLTALMGKLEGRNPMELTALGVTLQKHVSTNLSIEEILTIAITVIASDVQIDQFRLPVNSSFTQESRNEQAMLYDCDWATNAAQLHAFIYE